MQKTRAKLRLSSERLRNLTSLDLRQVKAGYQGDPITPECPSEYPMCSPT